MAEVAMPRLSDSMEGGTIVRWLKRDGDRVSHGEPLAEVEAGTASVTFDADADGTLRILVGEGTTVRIGQLIARIAEAPSERKAAPASGDNGAPGAKASAPARRLPRESGADLSPLTGSGPGGRIVKSDVAAGSGPGARIVKSDVAASAAEAPALARPARGNKGAITIQQPSRIQVQLAQRMAESKATIPDFSLRAEVDMEQAVALREQLRKAARSGEVAPSYNEMVVKACGLALREHPLANAAYRDGAFELYERVNIGIAVAAEESLIVPTLLDADRKSLLDIAREARTLAERVRQRTITPAELSGATFTVFNLGMYGVASFAAIINPSQAAILAVGELRELPVVREGRVVPGVRMSLVLTCDHRILYGAPAAEFLARLRALLEQPVYLLAS
ncbi:MAG: 2-oxo acid dehydrogenase subunit E2 [Solirubrobacterales bacterium]|nr:2-oxo acid dehydrogenase subunit E2 [Solirubrobacterales bacterium]